MTAIVPLDPFFLPLDVDDREGYLNKIRQATGLALHTDWPVVGADVVTHKELTIPQRELIEDCIDELRPFFSRFGYA